MKFFSLLIALLIVASTLSFAQEKEMEPIVAEMDNGYWIFLGENIPKDGSYKIERKVNKGAYKTLAKVTPAKKENDLKKRQKSALNSVASYTEFSDAELTSLWNLLKSSNKIQELEEFRGTPLTHLLIGTGYLDTKKVEAKKEYMYRITLLDSKGNPLSTKETKAEIFSETDKIPTLSLVEKKFNSGKISLVMAINGAQKPIAYNVYRSAFGKNNFKLINTAAYEAGFYSEKDSVYLIFEDSIGTEQDLLFEYKIVPTSIYGKEGASALTFVGGNVLENYAPSFDYFKGESLDTNHLVKLSWDFERKALLTGISVMKSDSLDGDYAPIAYLSVEDSVYFDVVPTTGVDYYYYLKLHSLSDEAGESSKIFAGYYGSSGSTIAPTDVIAQNIEGGVQIMWKSNAVYGKNHVVLRKKATDTNFVQVSELIPASTKTPIFYYVDSSATLQGGIAYQYVVRTINQDHKVSANSDTVTSFAGVRRKLTAPMNIRYRMDNKFVTLLWEDMSNWDEHLKYYNVYRKTTNSEWTLLERDTINYSLRNKYIDSSITEYGNYTYGIQSVDFFNNHSEIEEVAIEEIKSKPLPPPVGIKLMQAEDGIILTWGQTATPYKEVKIYRSVDDKEYELLSTTNENEYYDQNGLKDMIYSYQFSFVSLEGLEGNISKDVTITIAQ